MRILKTDLKVRNRSRLGILVQREGTDGERHDLAEELFRRGQGGVLDAIRPQRWLTWTPADRCRDEKTRTSEYACDWADPRQVVERLRICFQLTATRGRERMAAVPKSDKSYNYNYGSVLWNAGIGEKPTGSG